MFQLTAVMVADEPSAWAAAGFTMAGNATRVGNTTVVCDPGSGDGGITEVSIEGLDGAIDGLSVRQRALPPVDAAVSSHPNRVSGFDHLVVMSPAIERTSTALSTAGLSRRRTREFTVGDEVRRQDFFWLGDVILELVGLQGVAGDGPASFWGLALECGDLDAAAADLGDRLGRVKDAVQPGRRIATMRTRDLGISVPIALMSPHVSSS